MTLAYNKIPTKSGVSGQVFTGYIVATANDATTSVTGGAVIDNSDNDIVAIHALAKVTASGGTSPTLNLKLMSGINGTDFTPIRSADASPVNIESGATSISSPTVLIAAATPQELRSGNFNRKIRVDVDLGGTSPTANYTVDLYIQRSKK